MNALLADFTDAWHPIASSSELVFRHVAPAQLLGQEFAVWRADDGTINVWENRCLHRGVRLSIGINDGAELVCQYHGWRYANRTAGCTYIPAHPANAPARRIRNRTFEAVERFGLVWSSPGTPGPFDPPLKDTDWFALRPIPVNAAPLAVVEALAVAGAEGTSSERLGKLGIAVTLEGCGGEPATFFVQPVDTARAVIRGLVAGPPNDPAGVLKAFNTALSRLRDGIEAAAASQPAPEPIPPHYEPVSVELATMPDVTLGRQGQLRVKVARKWQTATDITGLELSPIAGTLPTFQPGAHIDVHLPNGIVRQYSVTNGPGSWVSYVIAAKRETASGGGSQFIAEALREGDVLAISEPRNNFPLQRNATNTVFVAGGIGMTPLLSMAKALDRMDADFSFHMFARARDYVPFSQDLDALGERVAPHYGLTPQETGAAIAAAIGPYGFARHLYVCGPGPMIEATQDAARKLGWPEEAVHFEFFKNDRTIDKSTSFTVELARSALTLDVPAGRSILDVLRENGVDMPSSCEQGACGTCVARVISGTPDHQDVYLSGGEKASNTSIMTCVSRALSDKLVLDI